MIVSFRDDTTQDIFDGKDSKQARKIPHAIWKIARRKLDMLNSARELRELRLPPSNHLEALKENLIDYFSIRVNDQYRVVFRWHDGNANEVRIIDYH